MKDNKKTDILFKNGNSKSSGEFKQNSSLFLTLGFSSLLFYLLISTVFLGRIDGLDPEHFDHWVKTIFEFSSSPFDISVLSPFQGMGGLCQPIAARIHIPFLMGFIFSPDNTRGIITVVSALLLGTAGAFFCYTIIKNIFLSILAGQFLAIFFFPPIWTFLLPWSNFFTTSLFSFLPATSYPVTLGIVFLALFQILGRGSNLQNAAITIALGLTFLYATLVDPLYTAMFWIPVAIFCAGILIGGETRRIWTWRICGAFACFFILWFLGIFKFYYTLFGNAARSVFPNELYVEIQKWDNLTGLFSYGGGAIIFSILIFASCIFLFFKSPRQLRYFSLSVGAYFCAMVVVSLVYVYSGMRWNLPLPVYLEIGAAPAYAIIVIIATHRAINLYFKNIRLAFHRIPRITFVIFLPLLSASILGFFLIVNPDLLKRPSTLVSKNFDGIVSKILAPNISIGPDGLFRGSVAMVAAVPGGEIMRRAGIPSETPFQKDHILFLSRYLRSYEEMHSASFLAGITIDKSCRALALAVSIEIF
jgi:hypothetical protein